VDLRSVEALKVPNTFQSHTWGWLHGCVGCFHPEWIPTIFKYRSTCSYRRRLFRISLFHIRGDRM